MQRFSPSFSLPAGALIEMAINISVLRAQLDLGPNDFVIRTEGGSFDFRSAFHEALGGCALARLT